MLFYFISSFLRFIFLRFILWLEVLVVKLEETVEGGETCKRHILTHKNTTKGKVGLNMRVERERAKGRYGDNIDNYMTRTTQLSFVCSLACSFSCFSLFSFLLLNSPTWNDDDSCHRCWFFPSLCIYCFVAQCNVVLFAAAASSLSHTHTHTLSQSFASFLVGIIKTNRLNYNKILFDYSNNNNN